MPFSLPLGWGTGIILQFSQYGNEILQMSQSLAWQSVILQSKGSITLKPFAPEVTLRLVGITAALLSLKKA